MELSSLKSVQIKPNVVVDTAQWVQNGDTRAAKGSDRIPRNCTNQVSVLVWLQQLRLDAVETLDSGVV